MATAHAKSFLDLRPCTAGKWREFARVANTNSQIAQEVSIDLRATPMTLGDARLATGLGPAAPRQHKTLNGAHGFLAIG